MTTAQMEQLRHRLYPDIADLSPELNVDVAEIKAMREATKEAKDEAGNPAGPILDAIVKVKGFNCSAPEWGAEHLKRFQIVALNDVTARYIFPEEHLPSDADSTMIALKNEGFFNPTVQTITHGDWKQDKLYHFVFLSIMQILRGGDGTPTPRASPKVRVRLPRESKLAAIEEMDKMYTAVRDALLPPLSRISSGSTMSSIYGSEYVPSVTMANSKTIVDRGPRETLTFHLFHDFLTYLGTVEQQKRQKDKSLWIPRYHDLVPFLIAQSGCLWLPDLSRRKFFHV